MQAPLIKLIKFQLINTFHLNEYRFTKDSKKKKNYIIMFFLYTFLVVCLLSYIILLSIGLTNIGLSTLLPCYFFTLTSIVILFFSFFKTNSVIFDIKTYDTLISMPIKKSTIVISRFIVMYLNNLVLSFVVMIPGLIFYALNNSVNFGFYPLALITTSFLPLLPMTIATLLNTLVTYISSFLKRKSIVSAFLLLALFLILMIGINYLTTTLEFQEVNELKDLVLNFSNLLERIYLPTAWYNNIILNNNFLSLFLYLGVSIIVWITLIYLLQKSFRSIIIRLQSHAKSKKEYQVGSLSTSSTIISLYKKELKRYFSSSIYVLNTIVSYLMMLVIAIALVFMGIDKTANLIGINILSPYMLILILCFPAVMMPTTTSSISLEGKQFWIVKTLPIKTKDLLNSKILVNLTIVFPFYFVSVILMIIALNPSFITLLAIIFVPAIYIIFSSVLGITFNLKFPLLNYENEVKVVKQSTAVFCSLFASLITIFVPILLIYFTNDLNEIIVFSMAFVLLVATIFLYNKNNKNNLVNIE